MAQEQTYATGRRKTAIARVWITPGSGKVAINKMELYEYFGNIFFEPKVAKPFAVTETVDQFDVQATVKGGGIGTNRRLGSRHCPCPAGVEPGNAFTAEKSWSADP